MPVLEYQKDGSIFCFNDAGDKIIVPPGLQADQDAAISAHVGQQEPPPPTLEEQVKAMALLLVQKGVATDAEIKDATAIDTAAIALEAARLPNKKG